MVASGEGNWESTERSAGERHLFIPFRVFRIFLPCALISSSSSFFLLSSSPSSPSPPPPSPSFSFFFFFSSLNKSFGFGRGRDESGVEGDQMDPVSEGLIPGLPLRRDSRTVSEGPGLAVSLSPCPRVIFLHGSGP